MNKKSDILNFLNLIKDDFEGDVESPPTAPITNENLSEQLNNIGQTINSNIEQVKENQANNVNHLEEKMSQNKSNMEMNQASLSISEYVSIKENITAIKTSIDWMKWIIPLFITIGIFVSGIITNSIKDSNKSQYEKLEQKLDNIQKINSMQIQRDVSQEFLKQKNNLK